MLIHRRNEGNIDANVENPWQLLLAGLRKWQYGFVWYLFFCGYPLRYVLSIISSGVISLALKVLVDDGVFAK